MNSASVLQAPARPRRVTRAAYLALGAFGVALINTFRLAPVVASMPYPSATLTYTIITSALWLLLLLAVLRGRNWARLVFVIMSLLSVPGVLFALGQGFASSLVAVSALQALLNSLAAVLLLTPVSAQWFGHMKAYRASLGAGAA